MTPSPYLRLLISSYLQLFKLAFPSVNIIPKQHYLTHVQTDIENLGSSGRTWCMRFEAKQSLFKSLTSRASFKNTQKFLAEKHQRHLCMLLQDENLFASKYTLGPKVLLFNNFSADVLTFLSVTQSSVLSMDRNLRYII